MSASRMIRCFSFLLTHLMRGATSRPDVYYLAHNFYSRTSCEVRLRYCHKARFLVHFYSRTSCEVRPFALYRQISHMYFYSRTSCEVRLRFSDDGRVRNRFLLTHLMRGATSFFCCSLFSQKFLLTHLMRGATVTIKCLIVSHEFLLTHLMRGATYEQHFTVVTPLISTHAPHARCDSARYTNTKGI